MKNLIYPMVILLAIAASGCGGDNNSENGETVSGPFTGRWTAELSLNPLTQTAPCTNLAQVSTLDVRIRHTGPRTLIDNLGAPPPASWIGSASEDEDFITATASYDIVITADGQEFSCRVEDSLRFSELDQNQALVREQQEFNCNSSMDSTSCGLEGSASARRIGW